MNEYSPYLSVLLHITFKFSFTTLLSRSLKILLFWSNQYPQSLICRCFSSPFAYFSYTSIGGMNDSSNSVPVVRFMRNNL